MLLPHATMGLTPTYGKVVHWSRTWQQEFEERQQLRLQLEEEDDLATTAPVELQVAKLFFRGFSALTVNFIIFLSIFNLKVIYWWAVHGGVDRVPEPVNKFLVGIPACLGWLLGVKGGFRVTKDPSGKGNLEVGISAVNAADPSFLPPRETYSTLAFPKTFLPDDDWGFNEYTAHFMSLCMKVAYESTPFLMDVVETDWMWKLEADIQTEVSPSNRSAATFVPQMRAFVISNNNAAVLIFRGTDSLDLAKWISNGDASMACADFIYGYVHKGFYEALFHNTADTLLQYTSGNPGKNCIFEQIIEELLCPKYKNKALYVTGHSLGGALVTIFAHCLAFRAGIAMRVNRRSDMSHNKSDVAFDGHKSAELVIYKRIMANGGIYTFGSPRAGDSVFADYVAGGFQGKTFRLVHAADIVPKVPTMNLGFRHHPKEYFLTTFGCLLHNSEAIELSHAREDMPLNFFALYYYKIFSGLFYYRETFLRTMQRILFLIVPAFTDHWPSDYEVKLRYIALNARTSGHGVINTGNSGDTSRSNLHEEGR